MCLFTFWKYPFIPRVAPLFSRIALLFPGTAPLFSRSALLFTGIAILFSSSCLMFSKKCPIVLQNCSLVSQKCIFIYCVGRFPRMLFFPSCLEIIFALLFFRFFLRIFINNSWGLLDNRNFFTWVFYVFYSLHYSLENAVSEYLERLEFQNFARGFSNMGFFSWSILLVIFKH